MVIVNIRNLQIIISAQDEARLTIMELCRIVPPILYQILPPSSAIKGTLMSLGTSGIVCVPR